MSRYRTDAEQDTVHIQYKIPYYTVHETVRYRTDTVQYRTRYRTHTVQDTVQICYYKYNAHHSSVKLEHNIKNKLTDKSSPIDVVSAATIGIVVLVDVGVVVVVVVVSAGSKKEKRFSYI